MARWLARGSIPPRGVALRCKRERTVSTSDVEMKMSLSAPPPAQRVLARWRPSAHHRSRRAALGGDGRGTGELGFTCAGVWARILTGSFGPAPPLVPARAGRVAAMLIAECDKTAQH